MQKKHWIFIGTAFVISLGLAFFLSPYASRSPDGLEKVLEETGGSRQVNTENPAWKNAPMPDYTVPGAKDEKLSTGLAGVIGTVLVFVLATALGWLLYIIAKKKKADNKTNTPKFNFNILLFVPAVMFYYGYAYGTEGVEMPSMPGPLTTWTAPVCGHRNCVFQPLFFYTSVNGTFDSDGSRKSLADGENRSQAGFQFFNQYGLSGDLEFAWQLNTFRNSAESAGESADSSGIGDSFVALRYGFRGCETGSPAISGLLQLKLPAGRFEDAGADKLGTDLMGTGSYDITFGANLTQYFKGNLGHLDLLYTIPVKTDIGGVETRYGNILSVNLACELGLGKGFNYMLEFNFTSQGNLREEGDIIADTSVYNLLVGTGIGWSGGNWQALFGYQRTLDGKNTDAVDAVALTIIFAF